MEQEKNSVVNIAGLLIDLHGSLPIFDDFVCDFDGKSDVCVKRVFDLLLCGDENLIAQHDDINVYGKKDDSFVIVCPKCADNVQISLSADYKTINYYIVPCPNEKVFEPVLRNLFRMAIESLYCGHSRISLHSACVDVNGYAVSFTGVSGLGKSTRASAWVNANNAEFISGDRPTLQLTPNGVVAYGVPWDGKEQIFRPVSRPLKAILEVRRSDSVYLRKLDEKQAEKLLMKQAFIPMWDTNAATFTIMNVRRLAKLVPVYRLFCGPDEDSAREAYRILFENKIAEATKDMKIKEGFALRTVAKEYIVMPTGSRIAEFDGAIALNEVSAFLFGKMLNPVSKEDLVIALLDEYDVDKETAERDVDSLIAKFTEMGIME